MADFVDEILSALWELAWSLSEYTMTFIRKRLLFINEVYLMFLDLNVDMIYFMADLKAAMVFSTPASSIQ